LVELV